MKRLQIERDKIRAQSQDCYCEIELTRKARKTVLPSCWEGIAEDVAGDVRRSIVTYVCGTVFFANLKG